MADLSVDFAGIRLKALVQKYEHAEAGRSFRAFMSKERIGLADRLAMPARLRGWGLSLRVQVGSTRCSPMGLLRCAVGTAIEGVGETR